MCIVFAIPASFVTVVSSRSLPHERISAIDFGHLPCRYVLLLCEHGSPISLASVTAVGIPLEILQKRQPGMDKVLFSAPARIMYGRSYERRALRQETTAVSGRTARDDLDVKYSEKNETGLTRDRLRVGTLGGEDDETDIENLSPDHFAWT